MPRTSRSSGSGWRAASSSRANASSEMQVTWDEVRARRLERHSLTARISGAAALADLAHRTCGIHAQVMASAELSICARADGITQQDVRDPLWRDRTLVKAWTIRGTLHLHPAEELPLWYAALRAAAGTSSDEAHGMEAWRDPQGRLLPALEPDEVNEIRAAVLDALDGRCLLREELAAEVVRRVGPKVEQRLLSGFAFFGGADLCQGPPQGPKITLARP